MTKNFNRTVYVLQNRTTLFVDNRNNEHRRLRIMKTCRGLLFGSDIAGWQEKDR